MRRFSGLFVFLLMLVSAPLARAESTLIPAENVADIVYDDEHQLLYISNGDEIDRYQPAGGVLQKMIKLNGAQLMGMDLSPDGKTLAVADYNFDGGRNENWVHLIDLATLDDTKLRFPLEFMEGGTTSTAYGSDGALFVCSQFEGTGGHLPVRRVDPETGAVTFVDTTEVAGVLTHSGTRKTIAYFGTEGDQIGSYAVKNGKLHEGPGSGSGVSGLSADRRGTSFVVSGVEGSYFMDKTLQRNGDVIGSWDSGPVSSAFDPKKPLVYFPWAGTSQVRIYNTKTRMQVGAIDFSEVFDFPGTIRPYGRGTRTVVSGDGKLVFVTVSDGVRFSRAKAD